MPADPKVSTIKASVEVDVGQFADITFTLDRDGKPCGDATVDLPDGNTVDVENIAINTQMLGNAVRLPFYDALEGARAKTS